MKTIITTAFLITLFTVNIAQLNTLRTMRRELDGHMDNVIDYLELMPLNHSQRPLESPDLQKAYNVVKKNYPYIVDLEAYCIVPTHDPTQCQPLVRR